jgi:hypothetical protein
VCSVTTHFLNQNIYSVNFQSVASSARFDSTLSPWFQLVKATPPRAHIVQYNSGVVNTVNNLLCER